MMRTKLGALKAYVPFSASQLRLISDIGSLSLSTVLSRGLLFVRDVVLAGLLGPGGYGVWTQIVVILNYALHLPLGFQHVMSREVPYFLGQNNPKRATLIQDLAFIVILSTALLAGMGVLLAHWWFDYQLFGLSLAGLLVVVGVIIAQQINVFYSIILRAWQQFHVFSIGFLLVALLSLLLGAGFAMLWGSVGMALAQGVALLLVTGFWLARTSYRPGWLEVDFQEFKRLTAIAAPLFVIGIIGLMIVSIDRLIMMFFYSEEQIGYYGLAFIANQSIFLIVTPIVQALNPRLMQAYGQHHDPSRLKPYLVLLTQGMGSGVALLVGLLYLMIGSLILLFLPTFVPAIEATQWLLLGSTFSAVAIGGNAFLIAINKQRQVLLIQAMIIMLQVMIIGNISSRGAQIEQIAQGMTFAYLLYALLSVTSVGFNVEKLARNGILFCLRSMLPIVYILACAVFVPRWLINPETNTLFTNTIMHVFLFLLAILPALVLLARVVRKLSLKSS